MIYYEYKIYCTILYTEFSDDDFIGQKNWLKHYKEPWDEVKSKWKATAPKRRQSIKLPEFNINDILCDWPLYAHALVHSGKL